MVGDVVGAAGAVHLAAPGVAAAVAVALAAGGHVHLDVGLGAVQEAEDQRGVGLVHVVLHDRVVLVLLLLPL